MLYYALVFLVVAIIAGILGFGGIAGTATLDRRSSVRRFPGDVHHRAGDPRQAAAVGVR